MTQEKKERVFLASVALAVLIFVLAIIILIAQGITISNRKRELNALNREIAILQQMIDDEADEILIWQQKATIEKMARKLGYMYPEDVIK